MSSEVTREPILDESGDELASPRDQLSHPAIVLESPLREGEGWVSLAPRVRARSLAALLGTWRGGGAAPDRGALDRRMAILSRVCRAVLHAHEQGVAHLDIRPENVLIADGGEAYLTGWRADQRPGERASETEQDPGAEPFRERASERDLSPYMAPELIGGAGVDAQADIYALGALLYTLLTLRPPVEDNGEGAGQLRDTIAHGEIRPPSLRCPELEVPAELERLCMQALSLDPTRRPAGASAFSAALDDCRARLRARPRGPGPWGRGALWLAALAALAIGAFLMVELWRSRRAGDELLAEVERRERRAKSDSELAGLRIQQARRSEKKAEDAREVALAARKDAVEARAEAQRLAEVARRERTRAEEMARRATEAVERAESERSRAEAREAEARSARAQAENDRKVAERALRTAERALVSAETNLARSRVLQGSILLASDRVAEARRSYQEALAAYQRLGASSLPADLGLWELSWRTPSSLIDLDRAGAGERAEAAIWCVAASADGRQALIGNQDRSLELWNLEIGVRLRSFKGHEGGVMAVALSPAGDVAVSGSSDNSIKIWDLESGKEIRTLSGHSGPVSCLAFVPGSDRALLISGSYDGSVKLWNIRQGLLINSFEGHKKKVHAVAVSPDGQSFLSASSDKTVKLWKLSSKTEPRVYDGFRHDVLCLAFTPDGKRFLTGSYRVIHLWDLVKGRALATYQGHEDWVTSIAVRPRGGLVISGGLDHSVRLWSLERGAEVLSFAGHEAEVKDVVFAPKGLALSVGLDARLKVWDLASRVAELPKWRAHRGPVTAMDLSADGRLLLTGGADHQVKLWDVASRKLLDTFEGHVSEVFRVGFSPDGRTAFSTSKDRRLKLWEVMSGRALELPQNPGGYSAAFAPGGDRLISGGKETLHCWSLDDEVSYWNLNHAHPGAVSGLAFAPDGRALTISDSEVALWNTRTGRADARRDLAEQRRGELQLRALAIDGPGLLAAVAGSDQRIHLLEVNGLKSRGRLIGHRAAVTDLRFLDQGRTLVSAGLDGALKFWSVEDGEELKSFVAHSRGARSLAAARDKALAATGSEDGLVCLWDFRRPAAARALRAKVAEAHAALVRDPKAAEALLDLAAWYRFRSRDRWAARALLRARGAGLEINALTLARSAWLGGDPALARDEFERALSRRQAPADYLRLCLKAIGQPDPKARPE